MRKAGVLSILVLLAVAVVADAQQPKKVPRIGYLSVSDAATESAHSEAIRLTLRELGYIEGQNVAIEYRYGEGKLDRFPELAAELVRLKVDIIVVSGGNTLIRAAKNATKTIPIVMTGAGTDPVEAGFVESLARPGGNVTGLALLVSELHGKRLELLKETVPKLARVAVLYDPALPANVLQLKDLRDVARALGLTIQPWEVRSTDDFDRVFAALNKQRPDGLYVIQGRLMGANRKRIVGSALKSRLPSVHYDREFVDAGGLMSYGADPAHSYRRVAWYMDKILKGAKPADFAGRAAHEVRTGDQSQDGEADRPDDSTECAGAGGQSNSMSVKSEESGVRRKNIFCVALSAMLFALCASAMAQQPTKVFRIGYLSGTDRATDAPRAEGTRRALREVGYIEGQNIIVEYRHAEGKAGRNAALAAELVRLNVDLIVVAGGEGNILAATNATKTIPIVMMGQADPVKAGFVASLARPGGNVTGFTDVTSDLSGKRLELLKEAPHRHEPISG